LKTSKPTIQANPNKSTRTFLVFIVALLLTSIAIHFNIFILLLSILSLAGVYVCSLVILYLLDKKNPYTQKWCSAKGRYDCGKVLEAGRFSTTAHLGDVGLVYFMGQFLFLLVSNVYGPLPNTFLLLGFPVALGVVIGIFSVCYQGLLVKSWCKMCLAIVAVLWLQALVLVGYFVLGKANLLVLDSAKLLPVAFVYAACLLAAACWFAVPPIMAKAAAADNLRRQNLRWKKDGGLFLAMLQKQRVVDATVWENDFVLGNSDAPIKMVEAVNLYCPACAGQHRQLSQLLAENPNGLGLVLRFRTVPREASKHTVALKHILTAYFATNNMQEKHKILDDWYETMDLQKWQQRWPSVTIADGHEALINRHREWFAQSAITHTPTLFINGHEFPQPYIIADLRTLANPLLAAVAKQRSTEKIFAQQ
jgi:hypothetical protein